MFGFSRGAVQARAFCYWFQDMLKDGALAGIPASISFLGLFDSVATVGISYSANETIPVLFFWTDGHGAWAGEIKNTLPSCVQQGVHFIAAHEQRMNFPVTRVRGDQIIEYLYPGVHSDVGGGYGCRDQGRALSPENMLSQVPLLQMYKAALLAGVPLVHYDQMSDDLKADFNIGSQVVEAWNTYMAADNFGGSYETQVKQHMRLYYSYRSKWLYHDMKQNPAVIASNGQDRQDLLSYNALLKGDRELLSKRKVRDFPIGTDIYGSVPSPLSREPNAASIGNAWQVLRYDRKRPLNAWEQFADEVFSSPRTAKQEAACLLLERYVHDSLAGFWMAGYLSDEEKAEGILDMAKKGGPSKGDAYRQKVWQNYQAKPELQQIVQSKQDLQIKAEQARFNGQLDRRDELDRQSTFTPEEQAQLAELFPMQTDANAAELRHSAIKTQTWTLREGGGYFYPRVAF